jgi:hypothetical protein
MKVHSRRWGVGLLAVLAGLTVAGCTGTPSAGLRTSVGGATARFDGRARAAAQDLLTSSWASNGSVGFFVEAADPMAAMSLYNTRWWLDIYTGEHRAIPADLDSRQVGAWVTSVLSRHTTGVDADQLPVIERLDDGMAILARLHEPLDRSTVLRALNGLRRGVRYRSGAGKTPDWGDTFLALSLYRRLGVSAPALVRAAAAAQVRDALHDRTAADLLGRIVPALASLSAGPRVAAGPALGDELRWIAGKLATISPLARVSVAAALAPVLARAGLPHWPTAEICADLDLSSAGVAASTGSAPDPQLTDNALALGCAAHQVVPPWTPLGWPSRDAIDMSLPASVDGLRVAAAVGSAAQYAPFVGRELNQVWAPSLGRQDDPSIAAAADTLARELRRRPAAPASRPAVLTAVRSADPRAATPELLLGLLTFPRGLDGARSTTPPKRTSRASDASDLTLAIADELRFRLTRNPSLHATALRLLRPLALPSSLYALATADHASLFATVFGNWITGRPLPLAALRHAGSCGATAWPSCTDGDPATTVPALQIAAAAAVLDHPAPAGYPFAY